jgi:hypothetical protein
MVVIGIVEPGTYPESLRLEIGEVEVILATFELGGGLDPESGLPSLFVELEG